MTQIKNSLLNDPIREIHVDTQGECSVCDVCFTVSCLAQTLYKCVFVNVCCVRFPYNDHGSFNTVALTW